MDDICICGKDPIEGWEYFYPTPLCPDIECLIKHLCEEGVEPTIDNAIMAQVKDWEAGKRYWDRTEYSERDPEQADMLRQTDRDLTRLVRHKHGIVVPLLMEPQ